MSEISVADRISILETIRDLPADGIGQSDFFVMKQYARLCDPYRFIIVGSRGVGKTRVFNAITNPDGYRMIIGDQILMNAPDTENSTIIKGYCQSDNFPDARVLDQLQTDQLAQSFWVGSTLILLFALPNDGLHFIEIMNRTFGESSSAVFQDFENLLVPSRWIPFVSQNLEQCDSVLDEFDRFLYDIDRWVIIAYDDLDRLTTKFMDLFPFIRTLLSFWFKRSSHWERLRSKIFIRNDLFESRYLDFLDAAKARNSTLLLEWDSSSLYQLLVQKIAASGSEPALRYLNGIPGLIHKKDDANGFVPTNKLPLLQEFGARLMGKFMNDSPRYGLNYFWVPNHLQDGNGKLMPRPFIKCFSAAAQMMLKSKEQLDSLTGSQLILSSAIREAVVPASYDRFEEMLEEYPWLAQLKPVLRGRTIPMDRDRFVYAIDMDLWSDAQRDPLPERTPVGMYLVLQKIGIIAEYDRGLEVPDIYRYALEMERRRG